MTTGNDPCTTGRTVGDASPAVVDQQESPKAWQEIVAGYQQPSPRRASWQIVNTIGSYAALWFLIYLSLSVSWCLTLPLAVVAGALLVRVFIIFHDCGHGSFFRSQRANAVWGYITGLLAFTPYRHWRWEHSVHHATAGKLDRRGVGDIWTLTVQEYLEASRWKRFSYRLARNPIVLFVIAPFFLIVVKHRIPSLKAGRRERLSVLWMNLAVVSMVSVLCTLYGIGPYLLIQSTVMAVAGAAGVWLFYIQHQFEDTYWEMENWDYAAAALQGSSFYKLPRVLQWLSGNIGFHHIHHLNPRIPNYNLEKCHRSASLFQEVKPLTLFSSLSLVSLSLWDENTKEMVGFRALKQRGGKCLQHTA